MPDAYSILLLTKNAILQRSCKMAARPSKNLTSGNIKDSRTQINRLSYNYFWCYCCYYNFKLLKKQWFFVFLPLGKIFAPTRKFCTLFWEVNGGESEKLKKQNYGKDKWGVFKKLVKNAMLSAQARKAVVWLPIAKATTPAPRFF